MRIRLANRAPTVRFLADALRGLYGGVIAAEPRALGEIKSRFRSP